MRPLASWQSAVFLLNSRLGLFTAAPNSKQIAFLTVGSVPFPEVTGLFCRVP